MKSKRKEKEKRARPQPHLAFRASAATLSTFQMPPADGESPKGDAAKKEIPQPMNATYSAEQRALAMEQLLQQNTNESASSSACQSSSTAPGSGGPPSKAAGQGRPSSARFWTSFALAAAKKRLLLAKSSGNPHDGVDAVAGPPRGVVGAAKQRSLSQVGKQMFVDGTQSFPATPLLGHVDPTGGLGPKHAAAANDSRVGGGTQNDVGSASSGNNSNPSGLPVAQLVPPDGRVPPAAFFAAAAAGVPPHKFPEFSHVAAARAAVAQQQFVQHPGLLSHPAAVVAAQRVAAAAAAQQQHLLLQHQQQQQQQQQRGQQQQHQQARPDDANNNNANAHHQQQHHQQQQQQQQQQHQQSARPPMFLQRPASLNTMPMLSMAHQQAAQQQAQQAAFASTRSQSMDTHDRDTPTPVQIKRRSRSRGGGDHSPSYFHRPSYESTRSSGSTGQRPSGSSSSGDAVDAAFATTTTNSELQRPSFDQGNSFDHGNRPSFTDRNSFTERNSFLSVTDRGSFVGRPSAEEYARVLRENQPLCDDGGDLHHHRELHQSGVTQLPPSGLPGNALATFPSNQSAGSVFAARSSMQLSPAGSGGWSVPLDNAEHNPPTFPPGFRWDVLAGEAGDGADDDVDLANLANGIPAAPNNNGEHPPPSLVDDVTMQS
mmetsp:Transcript_30806/g.99323  ORF Transcript_30806/g.99323 Transcript_30806/m.99323 type:complete len:656 (-) Transcript_30806:1227-3194(-)